MTGLQLLLLLVVAAPFLAAATTTTTTFSAEHRPQLSLDDVIGADLRPFVTSTVLAQLRWTLTLMDQFDALLATLYAQDLTASDDDALGLIRFPDVDPDQVASVASAIIETGYDGHRRLHPGLRSALHNVSLERGGGRLPALQTIASCLRQAIGAVRRDLLQVPSPFEAAALLAQRRLRAWTDAQFVRLRDRLKRTIDHLHVCVLETLFVAIEAVGGANRDAMRERLVRHIAVKYQALHNDRDLALVRNLGRDEDSGRGWK